MANYYISDIHLHHPKCLEFDHRPFNSEEEMETEIIKRWNAKITANDNVYILGDFSMERKDVEKVNHVLRQLKGNKFLIKGNHDHYLKKKGFDISLFAGVYDYKCLIDNGQVVVLSHYPILVWDRRKYGSIHLYGHVHAYNDAIDYSYLRSLKNAYNVGCMHWNYEPVTLAEILEKQNNDTEVFDCERQRY